MRLALAEKRIPFDLRVERVWERRAEFLTINPACTVPVLQEENGFCIIDSYAICEYLDEAYPDMPLLGRSLGERAEIRRLVGGAAGCRRRVGCWAGLLAPLRQARRQHYRGRVAAGLPCQAEPVAGGAVH